VGGRRTSVTDANSKTTTHSHDDAERLASVTDSAGAFATTYTYDCFGILTASTGTLTNPFLYTAHEFDADTCFYYYRARYYDRSIGRFLGEDPIPFLGGAPFFLDRLRTPRRFNLAPLNAKFPRDLERWLHGEECNGSEELRTKRGEIGPVTVEIRVSTSGAQNTFPPRLENVRE
jgi:RHS repeat-associated protein